MIIRSAKKTLIGIIFLGIITFMAGVGEYINLSTRDWPPLDEYWTREIQQEKNTAIIQALVGGSFAGVGIYALIRQSNKR